MRESCSQGWPSLSLFLKIAHHSSHLARNHFSQVCGGEELRMNSALPISCECFSTHRQYYFTDDECAATVWSSSTVLGRTMRPTGASAASNDLIAEVHTGFRCHLPYWRNGDCVCVCICVFVCLSRLHKIS